MNSRKLTMVSIFDAIISFIARLQADFLRDILHELATPNDCPHDADIVTTLCSV